jgi:integrative and conjugative element protein (TIGR02256 family)
VLKKILSDTASARSADERGGILLGERRGPHFQVKEATTPMRWDRSSKFAFHRSSAGHQEVAFRTWKRSKHTIDWLGEWHSHPERIPSPSQLDIRTWQRVTAHHAAPMIFLIVGYEATWIGLSLPGHAIPVKYVATEHSAIGVAYVPSQSISTTRVALRDKSNSAWPKPDAPWQPAEWSRSFGRATSKLGDDTDTL